MGELIVFYFLHRKYDKKKRLDKVLIAYLCKIHITEIRNIDLRPGRIIVFTNNKIYKIQLSGENLEEDIHNCKKIFRNKFPANKITVLRKKPMIVSCDLLRNQMVNINDIVNLLLELGKSGVVKACNQEGIPKNIIAGLEALDYYKINKEQKRKVFSVIRDICKKEMRMGVVHGDLHSGNVLYDKKGRARLIDFDCSRRYDIQAFDSMYYIFETERAKNYIDWLLFWKKIWDNKAEIICKYNVFFKKLIDLEYEDIMTILLLERLGQEFKHNEMHDRKKLISALAVIISYYESVRNSYGKNIGHL